MAVCCYSAFSGCGDSENSEKSLLLPIRASRRCVEGFIQFHFVEVGDMWNTGQLPIYLVWVCQPSV